MKILIALILALSMAAISSDPQWLSFAPLALLYIGISLVAFAVMGMEKTHDI
jgi:hypothetical protein